MHKTYNKLPVGHDEKRVLKLRETRESQQALESQPSLTLTPTLNPSRTLPAHKKNRHTSFSPHKDIIIITIMHEIKLTIFSYKI